MYLFVTINSKPNHLFTHRSEYNIFHRQHMSKKGVRERSEFYLSKLFIRKFKFIKGFHKVSIDGSKFVFQLKFISMKITKCKDPKIYIMYCDVLFVYKFIYL